MPLAETFELILPGPPVSAQNQTGALPAWRSAIEAAALAQLGGLPDLNPGPLCFSAGNFFEGIAVEPDVDNMLKPIQDALIGVLYDDDRHIFDSLGMKRQLSEDIYFEGALSPLLADAFDFGEEFVHIQVSLQPQRHFVGL